MAGLFGRQIGRAGAHWVTILGVGFACRACCLFMRACSRSSAGAPAENVSLYTWLVVDGVRMEVGFLVDRLTSLMMVWSLSCR